MNNVNGFTFYRSYFECLDKLPEEDKSRLLRAIVYYVYKDENPDFEGVLSALWTVIKPNLDTSKNRSLNPQNKKKSKAKQQENKKNTNKKQKGNNDIIDNDKDKDKEIDKDKENDKERDKDLEAGGRNIYTIVEENFGRTLSPMEVEKINVWLEDYSEDVVAYAIRRSVLANKRNFSYVNAIIRNWKTNGYKTLQEIKDNDFSPYERNQQEPSKELFDFNWLEEDDE